MADSKDNSGGIFQDLPNRLLDALDKEDEAVLSEPTLEAVAEYIKSGKVKNVIVMIGAGVSTSAGIPDFRSPKSGLYDNLSEFNLPNPQAIFEIEFFLSHPEPFFKLSKSLYPEKLQPTPCHYFIRMLHDKKLLKRLYTQNIDTLEYVAGIPESEVVEAHGSFKRGHCVMPGCHKEYSQDWMKEQIFADITPRCECQSLVKPDIVFFGEALPDRFFECVQQDFADCDLLLIMGTSLMVQPFASLIHKVDSNVPRVLINMTKVGQVDLLSRLMGITSGLDFDSDTNKRDVCYLGTCDAGCREFADLLGWRSALEALISAELAKFDSESEATEKSEASNSDTKQKL